MYLVSDRHGKTFKSEVTYPVSFNKYSIEREKDKIFNSTLEFKTKGAIFKDFGLRHNTVDHTQVSRVIDSFQDSQDLGVKTLETSSSVFSSSVPNKAVLVHRPKEKSSEVNMHKTNLIDEKRAGINKKSIEKQEKINRLRAKPLEVDTDDPPKSLLDTVYSLSASNTPKSYLLNLMLKDKTTPKKNLLLRDTKSKPDCKK